jgi:hypothetical protein
MQTLAGTKFQVEVIFNDTKKNTYEGGMASIISHREGGIKVLRRVRRTALIFSSEGVSEPEMVDLSVITSTAWHAECGSQLQPVFFSCAWQREFEEYSRTEKTRNTDPEFRL